MRSPYRVLITTPNLDTAGMKYVIKDLIQGFDRSIVTASLCVHQRKGNSLEKELEKQTDFFLEIPLRIPNQPVWKLIYQVKKFSQQIKGRFDAIHSFDYSGSWTEGLVAKFSGLPWIVEKTNMSFSGYRWWLKCSLATRIVCLSHAQNTFLFKKKYFSRKTSVISTGIDLARFCKKNKEEEKRSRDAFKIPLGAFVLVSVAHLVPVKGHKELLLAFSEIIKDFPNAFLVLAGSGDIEYELELKNIAENLSIQSKVLFLGGNSNIPEVLNMSDGFILATRNVGRRESFGAVLVEAMACQLPVIATRSGGPEDIVVPEKTGWLVSPEGSKPLEKAIREMLADGKRCELFGEAGRQRVESLFTAKRMVEEYQKLYENVINAK